MYAKFVKEPLVFCIEFNNGREEFSRSSEKMATAAAFARHFITSEKLSKYDHDRHHMFRILPDLRLAIRA